MKKRIFALAVAVMMLASFATTASAAETQNPYELPYDVDSGEMFECSESLAVGDIRTRAILGTGTLYHSDPLIGYPHDLPELWNVKGSQPCTAGNQNAFGCLARDKLSRTF